MNKLKIIIVTFFIGLFSFGQKSITQEELNSLNRFSGETLYTHVNATAFVSGETLCFKLYCLNKPTLTQSNISKVAYVMLIDQNNKTIVRQKIFLNEGVGNSDIFIAPTIPSGVYKLVSYTKWMLNKEKNKYNENIITIVNPYNSNETSIKTSDNLWTTDGSSEIKSDWSLTTNKTSYSNRELVTITIKSKKGILDKGNFSLSVRKTEDIPSSKKLSSITFANSKNDTDTFDTTINQLILPEIRGEQISGKIKTNNSSLPIANIAVALSIPGKSFILKIVKTNANGAFLFSIDKEYSETKLIVQVVDQNKEDYSIALENDEALTSFNAITEREMAIDQNLASIIEKRAVANQIQNAYYTKKTDSLSKITNTDMFYNPLEKDYILDNYTRFPSLKETITEVVKEMYYTKENDNYTIGVRDIIPERTVSEPALVLVDGLVIQNINELFELKMETVYKISIVPSAYQYGSKLFSGIISIITKNNDYNTKTENKFSTNITIETPVAKKIYFKEDYSDPSKNTRIPDYRNQLLWVPELYLENNEKSISFYTSDVNGTFEIILEGFTEDGNPVSLKEQFEVK